jgi:tripartite-type tricarboxylate transporter receptor subunit TctC
MPKQIRVKQQFPGAGLFVGHDIAALQIEKACACKIAYILTKGGGAAAMKAVIAGEGLAGINNLSDAFRVREAGNIKILGVAGLERNEQFLPDVPTLKEEGLGVDNSSVNYRGLMVLKGTSQVIIDSLAAQVPLMFNHVRVTKRMKAGGHRSKCWIVPAFRRCGQNVKLP